MSNKTKNKRKRKKTKLISVAEFNRIKEALHASNQILACIVYEAGGCLEVDKSTIGKIDWSLRVALDNDDVENKLVLTFDEE